MSFEGRRTRLRMKQPTSKFYQRSHPAEAEADVEQESSWRPSDASPDASVDPPDRARDHEGSVREGLSPRSEPDVSPKVADEVPAVDAATEAVHTMLSGPDEPTVSLVQASEATDAVGSAAAEPGGSHGGAVSASASASVEEEEEKEEEEEATPLQLEGKSHAPRVEVSEDTDTLASKAATTTKASAAASKSPQRQRRRGTGARAVAAGATPLI